MTRLGRRQVAERSGRRCVARGGRAPDRRVRRERRGGSGLGYAGVRRGQRTQQKPRRFRRARGQGGARDADQRSAGPRARGARAASRSAWASASVLRIASVAQDLRRWSRSWTTAARRSGGRPGLRVADLRHAEDRILAVNDGCRRSPGVVTLVAWFPGSSRTWPRCGHSVEGWRPWRRGHGVVLDARAPLQAESADPGGVPDSDGSSRELRSTAAAVELTSLSQQLALLSAPVASVAPAASPVARGSCRTRVRGGGRAPPTADETSDTGSGVLADLVGGHGDRTPYLVAVANTAEMRGAGGMILSYGVLGSDGKVELSHFGRIDELRRLDGGRRGARAGRLPRPAGTGSTRSSSGATPPCGATSRSWPRPSRPCTAGDRLRPWTASSRSTPGLAASSRASAP